MKKNILLVFVTALICITGTSYAAYKLTAKEVSFDKSKTDLNSDNVQDSIDEVTALIKYGDAEAGDIAGGKTALVNGKKITGTLSNSSSMDVVFSINNSWQSDDAVYGALTMDVTDFTSCKVTKITGNLNYNATSGNQVKIYADDVVIAAPVTVNQTLDLTGKKTFKIAGYGYSTSTYQGMNFYITFYK